MQTEFAVIGAGVIGSSVAWHLGELGAREVAVFDSDLEGTLSSSELNAGGVRGTWTTPHHVAASRLSIDYFASVADEVGYRPCGYTWMVRPEAWAGFEKARALQTAMGWDVEVWDVAELKRRLPLLDKTDDLRGAFFGVRDGLVNPNRLKHHYRDQAKKTGRVRFVDQMRLKDARSSGVGKDANWDLGFLDLNKGGLVTNTRVRAKVVINCAGPWAAEVASILSYPVTSVPVRRQISIFDARDVDLTRYGMMVDPSGVYFHPEGTHGLAGFADPREAPGHRFDYDGESFFVDHIWPALFERSSKFEQLKHVTGWAGLYEVSPDHCAWLGKAMGAESVYEAHSFSGHGVMHSYAAGKVLAEEILLGTQKSIDLTMLSGARFKAGAASNLSHETQVI